MLISTPMTVKLEPFGLMVKRRASDADISSISQISLANIDYLPACTSSVAAAVASSITVTD